MKDLSRESQSLAREVLAHYLKESAAPVLSHESALADCERAARNIRAAFAALEARELTPPAGVAGPIELRDAVEAVGGATRAAELCGVSPRAVYKWLVANRLPRTDYTGETEHAERLAEASAGAFTADQIHASARDNLEDRHQGLLDWVKAASDEEIAQVGTSRGYLRQIAYRNKLASPAIAASVEAATDGVVTRQALRPDDWWALWPELVDLGGGDVD